MTQWAHTYLLVTLKQDTQVAKMWQIKHILLNDPKACNCKYIPCSPVLGISYEQENFRLLSHSRSAGLLGNFQRCLNPLLPVSGTRPCMSSIVRRPYTPP